MEEGNMLSFKIVTDKKQLSKPCKEVDVEEGIQLGEKMLAYLKENNKFAGIAANQIGINKRVCVINVTEPIILVNPKIISQFGKFQYKEGCLSFPGQYIITNRYANIMITADNHKEAIIFTAERNPLECACVQHEIDHLDGKTMFERGIK